MRKKVEPVSEESKLLEEVKLEGESLGFGFVSYSSIESAARARFESKTI